jgi:hypothetical protein
VGKIFHFLEELNDAIREITEQHKNTSFSGRSYSRRDLFEEIERTVLNPLPSLPYEFKRQQYSMVAGKPVTYALGGINTIIASITGI